MKANSNNINFTLIHDLCTGCGICEGICPKNAIITTCKNGNFRPVVDEELCINCGRCIKACPGLGVNLKGMAEELFFETTNENKMVGRYERCYTGHSTDYDIRYHSASGGMVSQFLIWLLEKKEIDGAIITKFDQQNDYLVKSFIATTKENVISGRSSKYSPVTLNHAIRDIKESNGTRYVVVGLPCHIHGFRKAMEIDKILKEKIVGLFAIYCSCGRSFSMTEFIFKERGISKDKINYFQYRDEGCLGKMVVKCPESEGKNFKSINEYAEIVLSNNERVLKEDYQSYYHPLRSFFIPRRCLFCIDHYGELADVSFGDIHIKPYSDDKVGINSVVVRSKSWVDLLERCSKEGFVHLDEVSFETISESQKMSYVKKGENGAFIKMGKTLGKVMPEYDVDYLRQPFLKDWASFVLKRSQQFLGNHRKLWPLISLLKAKVIIH